MVINSIKKIILNLLFPIKCIGCKKDGEILCDMCLTQIQNAERETEREILAVFDYRNDLIKKAIWELKYHHKKYIGERLGEILYESLIEEISSLRNFSLGEKIIIIPVPVSNKKQQTRGYNQSFSIALGFLKRDNYKNFQIENNLVSRIKDNIPQARLSNRKDRLQNIKGAFEIKDKNTIKNRIVIIIDDVTTTGGTINEIIKLSKEKGAKKVIGFTIAH